MNPKQVGSCTYGGHTLPRWHPQQITCNSPLLYATKLLSVTNTCTSSNHYFVEFPSIVKQNILKDDFQLKNMVQIQLNIPWMNLNVHLPSKNFVLHDGHCFILVNYKQIETSSSHREWQNWSNWSSVFVFTIICYCCLFQISV